MQVDAAANGSEVELGIGESLDLCLDENQTTGYRWDLYAEGQPVCTLTSHAFEGPGGAPGRGGRHCWHFQTVQAGQTAVELRYRRPWEQVAPLRTFRLGVSVRSHGTGPAP